MASLAETQAAFAAAIYDAGAPIPPDVFARGAPVRRIRGFAAYRNNVFVALVNLMTARFPAVQRIVGEEFFRATARAFVQEHAPEATLNLSYGAGFPAFLASFPPVAQLPYLSDIARLEWALHEAAIAPDADRLPASTFADVGIGSATGLRFVLHPSLQVIRSTFPIVSIWEMNVQPDSGETLETALGPEEALIVRPRAEARVHRLPRGGADFVCALGDNMCVAVAAEAALDAYAEVDLAATLVTLLEAGGVIATVDGEK